MTSEDNNKKIIYIMITIVGALALTGCGNFLKYYIRQAPDEAMEEYLEEKYDDDVTCLEWYAGEGFDFFWNKGYFEGTFESKKYPDVEIECGAFLKEGGWTYRFHDDYQGEIYRANVQETMKEIAAKYFKGEYYVVAEAIGGRDEDTVKVMPFEEYIKRYLEFRVTILAEEMSDMDAIDAMQEFVADAQSQGFQCSFCLGKANTNIISKEEYYECLMDETRDFDMLRTGNGIEWHTKSLYKYLLPVTEGKSEPEIFNIIEEELKEAGFDSDILEIETYTYPDEFVLGPNLNMAITELALMYDDFDKSKIDEDIYQTSFIWHFCQNSRTSFDYLEKMRKKDKTNLSEYEVRYIQYSLTKENIYFSEIKEPGVDINQASSGFSYGQILSYEAVEDGEEVHLVAEFERGSDGTEITTLYELTVVLVNNPYSCFDGYSIKSLSSKDITPVVPGDNKEHTFYGCDLEVEEDGVFTFENYGGEDDVQYGRHIKVDLSANPAEGKL